MNMKMHRLNQKGYILDYLAGAEHVTSAAHMRPVAEGKTSENKQEERAGWRWAGDRSPSSAQSASLHSTQEL